MIICVRGVSVLIAHAQDTTNMNTDWNMFIIEGPLYQVQLMMFSPQQHGDSQTGSAAEVLQTKYRLDSLS